MYKKKESLAPQNHNEAVALFRMQVVGELAARTLKRGELADGLREISERSFRPPGSAVSRRYAVPTLQRWFYRYRRHGIDGLRPQDRAQGFALVLSAELRRLLVEIRQDSPSLFASQIVSTLEREGRLEKGAVSCNTVRRLYRAHGLPRLSPRQGKGPAHTRLRWEAERPGQIWHADVCHGPALMRGERKLPLRIHGIMDDASRYIVGLQALHTEREADMLALFMEAIRRHGKPEVLYVDNGSTYRGETLAIACSRLGIKLCHAQPYDPQARGKMERFWRTLREGCIDHQASLAELHDVQIRLLAFVEREYHLRAHSSLIGKAPAARWAEGNLSIAAEKDLRDALTVRFNRRFRGDGTVSIAGVDWESSKGFLAGCKVVMARALLHPSEAPWVEYNGKIYVLKRVDAVANSKKRRPPRHARGADAIPFDPVAPLVDELLGRDPKGGGK